MAVNLRSDKYKTVETTTSLTKGAVHIVNAALGQVGFAFSDTPANENQIETPIVAVVTDADLVAIDASSITASQGDIAYVTYPGGNVATTAGVGNIPVGTFTKACATGDTTAQVRWVEYFSGTVSGNVYLGGS